MTSDSSPDTRSSSDRSYRKWIVTLALFILFATVMWTVINPYRGQTYEKVPHGDHVHYVPKDRNEEVPMSRFPTREPNQGERITPDGQIVEAGSRAP
jgi:hypothetical protein